MKSRYDGTTIEGKQLRNYDWVAMDLGNIALHLFTEETREKYDLESLWSVGSEFDTKTQEQKQGQMIGIEDILADLKPLSWIKVSCDTQQGSNTTNKQEKKFL